MRPREFRVRAPLASAGFREGCPRQLGSAEQQKPVHNDLQTTGASWLGMGRSKSLTKRLVETRTPASRQTHAVALSKENPPTPQDSSSRTRCTVVAKDVEWTATPSSARSERESNPDATKKQVVEELKNKLSGWRRKNRRERETTPIWVPTASGGGLVWSVKHAATRQQSCNVAPRAAKNGHPWSPRDPPHQQNSFDDGALRTIEPHRGNLSLVVIRSSPSFSNSTTTLPPICGKMTVVKLTRACKGERREQGDPLSDAHALRFGATSGPPFSPISIFYQMSASSSTTSTSSFNPSGQWRSMTFSGTTSGILLHPDSRWEDPNLEQRGRTFQRTTTPTARTKTCPSRSKRRNHLAAPRRRPGFEVVFFVHTEWRMGSTSSTGGMETTGTTQHCHTACRILFSRTHRRFLPMKNRAETERNNTAPRKLCFATTITPTLPRKQKEIRALQTLRNFTVLRQ